MSNWSPEPHELFSDNNPYEFETENEVEDLDAEDYQDLRKPEDICPDCKAGTLYFRFKDGPYDGDNFVSVYECDLCNFQVQRPV